MSFLDALACKNRRRPPVWLMRQAGRFLPEYRALREKHSLYELFHNSDLASQVTRLPLDILGVDAAILFSDILVLVEAFGFKLHFPEGSGPIVEPLLETPEQVRALFCQNLEEKLAYVFQTIRLLKHDLKVTLIGFSLNDTIIVYDRIREVRGMRTGETLPQIINHSVNSTLSRTVLTSGLAFLSVFSLYLFGGQVIHDFALAMLIGIVVGTFSSIYVAAPIIATLTPPEDLDAPAAPVRAKAKTA